jgi:hypothetical protein
MTRKKMNNLQLLQKDMEKEITQLESFIKSDIDARELKRAIAVKVVINM